jgi:PAS domain S-box-containing protein
MALTFNYISATTRWSKTFIRRDLPQGLKAIGKSIIRPAAAPLYSLLTSARNKIFPFISLEERPRAVSPAPEEEAFYITGNSISPSWINEIRGLPITEILKLADLIVDSVFITDAVGNIVFPYNMEDYMRPGQRATIFDLAPKRLAQKSMALYEIIKEKGSVIDVRGKIMALDGAERTVIVSAKALRSAETGKYLGAVNFMHDVTDMERVEGEYRALIDEAPLAILRVDYTTAKIIEVNERLLELSGYSRDGVEGKNIGDFMSGEDLQKVFDALIRRLEEKTDFEPVQVQLKLANDEYIPVEILARVIPGLEEDFVFIRDLRKGLREWEALVTAERRAIFGEQVGHIAHEISGFMSGLGGLAEGVLRKHPDETFARLIVDRVDKMKAFLDTLLKLVSGGEIERVLIQMDRQLESILALDRSALMEAGVDVKFNSEEEIPFVLATETEIHDIFRNLIINARQAMFSEEAKEWGKLRISVRHEGDDVVVEVSDTGPGIPDDVMVNMWETFFSTKPTGEGSGLGLPIVKDRVERLGGRIEVESEVGEGTTFKVILPAYKPPA